MTAVNSRGRSYVLTDEEIPESGDGAWTFDATTTPWVGLIDPASVPAGIEPPPGATRLLVAQVAADATMRADTTKRLFHATRTIDFVYLLEGRRILELDDGSIEIGAGDLVIQQATRHAWRNPTRNRVMVMLHRIG